MDTQGTGSPLGGVTGASSGIGLALARVFAENGFEVVVAAEDAATDASAEKRRGQGRRITAVRAALATPEGVEQLVAAVGTAGGGRAVDAAAINAGVGVGGRFVETRLEDHLRL